jgi:hypothetical protein
MARRGGRPNLTPAELLAREAAWFRAWRELPVQLRRDPTMAEVAKSLGVSVRTAHAMQREADELRRARLVAAGLPDPGDDLVDLRQLSAASLRRVALLEAAFWGELTPGEVAARLGLADDRDIRRDLDRMLAEAEPEVRAEIERRRRSRH